MFLQRVVDAPFPVEYASDMRDCLDVPRIPGENTLVDPTSLVKPPLIERFVRHLELGRDRRVFAVSQLRERLEPDPGTDGFFFRGAECLPAPRPHRAIARR